MDFLAVENMQILLQICISTIGGSIFIIIAHDLPCFFGVLSIQHFIRDYLVIILNNVKYVFFYIINIVYKILIINGSNNFILKLYGKKSSVGILGWFIVQCLCTSMYAVRLGDDAVFTCSQEKIRTWTYHHPQHHRIWSETGL